MSIFLLVAAAVFSIALALSVSSNAASYASNEMDRVGFGDVTAWLGGSEDIQVLANNIAASPEVASVTVQPLVFSGYTLGDYHSDNEGQILAFDAEAYPYAFLDNSLTERVSVDMVEAGEVYVSPALLETAKAQVGDSVSFSPARTGEPQTFVIAGCFEDPFMGSSMIDMKSFLISPNDYANVISELENVSPSDVLAWTGAMLHITQASDSPAHASSLERALAENNNLASSLEFSYSREALLGFALLQSNVVSGILALFAGVLVAVAFIVLSHAVASSIELERRNIAVLKTMGWTNTALRAVQLIQYLCGAVAGMVAGLVTAVPASGVASAALIASLGMLAPSDLALGWSMAACTATALILIAVVLAKTRAIVSVSPVEAFGSGPTAPARRSCTPLSPRTLGLTLAVRRIATTPARYAAVVAVAAVLALFISTVDRIDAWVGPNGEGLMDTFSAADHDIGVQPLNPTDMQAVEGLIGQHDTITGVYSLAMQPVRAGGTELTANVIDAPEQFHILEGKTSTEADEVVITRTVAANLGLSVGDTVDIAGEGSTQPFRVSGIYQCANEMGMNVGMSMEGYARMGDVRGYIWCYHYLLENGTDNDQVAADLQQAFGASAAIHTNSWSGLSGLVDTMRLIVALLWVVAVLLVLASTALASGKLLVAERMDMAVFKGIGFTSRQLRASFSLRMGLVAAVGATCGLIVSSVFADAAISQLLRTFGIGAFSSHPNFAEITAPVIAVGALAMLFSYLFSRPIKRSQPVALFADFDE